MKWRSMFSLALAGLALPASAGASAQAVYPPGASFGILPFEGAEIADGFAGFINPETMASVVIIELPLSSYPAAAQSLRLPSVLLTQGVTAHSVEDGVTAGMASLRVRGSQPAHGTTFAKCILVVEGKGGTGILTAQTPRTEDATDACALINGLQERAVATLDDKLAALPFRFGDLGGFRVVDVVAGANAILTRGPADGSAQPSMIVARSLASIAPEPEARIAVSEAALRDLSAYRDVEIIESSQVMVDGAAATKLVATALSHRRGEVRVVQWMRFGAGGTLRLIGEAPPGQWDDSEAAFEEVVDAIRTRL